MFFPEIIWLLNETSEVHSSAIHWHSQHLICSSMLWHLQGSSFNLKEQCCTTWATLRKHVASQELIRFIKRILKVQVQLERFLCKLEYEYILARSESPEWAVGSMQEKLLIKKIRQRHWPQYLSQLPQSPDPCKAGRSRRERRHAQRGEQPSEKCPMGWTMGQEIKPAHQQPITTQFLEQEKMKQFSFHSGGSYGGHLPFCTVSSQLSPNS